MLCCVLFSLNHKVDGDAIYLSEEYLEKVRLREFSSFVLAVVTLRCLRDAVRSWV